MDTQGWYTVTEFAPGSYQIVEGGRYHMFLFLGRDRAVAMDGGVGVGNLRKLHESITDLPIDFILTHTHWDHLGGAHQWAKLGVHPKGKDQLAKDHAARAQGWAKQWGKPFPAGFDPASFTIRPSTFGWTLQEGGTFDLGGRRFRVFDTPGHSPDSISLLDEREGVLVTGDLVKPLDCLYLQVPTAILPDYAPSLRKLEKIAGEVKWICSGHTQPFGDASIIGEMARFMEEIEAGRHEKAKKRFTPPGWGPLDEYEAKRFKVWIGDHARK
ncbi:MAG: MBL fold metallo-hydrolase [Candidatus Tectomicrobia bacterium]|nr:MBL fold metallo-hydrolase [Candidatus Tectomicrobia bacterium]